MQLTVARWACLITGMVGMLSSNTALGVIFIGLWMAVGTYQMLTGKL
jgi:hypothetical protein